MKILFLCGVSQIGKSTKIRHSVKFLNTDNAIKYKFYIRERTRTRLKLLIWMAKLHAYSLIHLKRRKTAQKSLLSILDKINTAYWKKDLLVTAFNISKFQDKKTDACLKWIETSGHKPMSFFTYLDSNTALDIFSREKMKNIEANSFNILPAIERSDPNSQGKKFAEYIMNLL